MDFYMEKGGYFCSKMSGSKILFWSFLRGAHAPYNFLRSYIGSVSTIVQIKR